MVGYGAISQEYIGYHNICNILSIYGIKLMAKSWSKVGENAQNKNLNIMYGNNHLEPT